jgi:hypothetical protein
MTPMLLVAAAILAAEPPRRPSGAVAQATATIRIVRAVTLKLDGSLNDEAPAPRTAVMRSVDGAKQSVKLIEFQ